MVVILICKQGTIEKQRFIFIGRIRFISLWYRMILILWLSFFSRQLLIGQFYVAQISTHSIESWVNTTLFVYSEQQKALCKHCKSIKLFILFIPVVDVFRCIFYAVVDTKFALLEVWFLCACFSSFNNGNSIRNFVASIWSKIDFVCVCVSIRLNWERDIISIACEWNSYMVDQWVAYFEHKSTFHSTQDFKSSTFRRIRSFGIWFWSK